ncbi:MAG: hypothetical protein ACM3JJ_11650 [Hyphomicrobiales bacterium]
MRHPSESFPITIGAALLAAIVTLLASLAAPPRAAASLLPTMASAGLGVHPGEAGTRALPLVPTLNAGWMLSDRLTLMTNAAYLTVTSADPILVARAASGYSRDLFGSGIGPGGGSAAHYLPVGLGVRLYLQRRSDGSRGLFLEGSPTLTAAWLPYNEPIRGHDLQWLRGIRAGVGARFAAADHVRGEIGGAYYYMETTRTRTDLRTALGFDGFATRVFRPEAFSLYVAFGFGD